MLQYGVFSTKDHNLLNSLIMGGIIVNWLWGAKIILCRPYFDYEKLCHIKKNATNYSEYFSFTRINKFVKNKKWYKNSYNMFFHKRQQLDK